MDSLCLSTAGIRFWEPPIPIKGFSFPCSWLTSFLDLIGVITFHTDEMRLGWVPSMLRGLGVLVFHKLKRENLLTHTTVSAISVVHTIEAFMRVYSRSPVQSSLNLVTLLAKCFLRHYPELQTLPLLGTPVRIRDRDEHFPRGDGSSLIL